MPGMEGNGGAETADVSALFLEPESYNEMSVRVHACVSVTLHGITLVACDAKNPQINVEAGEGSDARKAYSRLIEFAHAHMGQEPQKLPVVIEGVYRSKRVRDEYRHTIYVTGFREAPEKGPEAISSRP